MNTKTLRSFYLKTIRFDIINKFPIKNTKRVSKIKKIVLNFGCKPHNIKNLATSLLALELITKQKSEPTVASQPNLELKIRKGNPVGCKITLRKIKVFSFIYRTLLSVFPQLKNFEGLKILPRRLPQNTLTYVISDMFNFKELEDNYHLFQVLSNLRVTIIVEDQKQYQSLFLIKSFKTPLLAERSQI